MNVATVFLVVDEQGPKSRQKILSKFLMNREIHQPVYIKMQETIFQSRGQYLVKAKDISPDVRLYSPPQPNEVQIAVRSTTICGSDFHSFSTGRNGSIVPREPLCLGRESLGDVVNVGSRCELS